MNGLAVQMKQNPLNVRTYLIQFLAAVNGYGKRHRELAERHPQALQFQRSPMQLLDRSTRACILERHLAAFCFLNSRPEAPP